MVDENDVLHVTPSERARKARFDAAIKEFSTRFKEYKEPNWAALQGSVEAGTVCGKCRGEIRAVLADVQPSQTFATDLDVLVSMNCRNAECGWTCNQWRTWVRTKPTEL